MNKRLRLDKLISARSNLSRVEAKQAICRRQVYVDGLRQTDPSSKWLESSTFTLAGQNLSSVEDLYLVLHKPLGFVSARADGTSPILLDLVPHNFRRPDLQIVGRLDKDTSGLIFLTTDGQWNHRVTSPKKACKKRYIATLDRPVEAHYIESMAEGILLNNEDKPTLPSTLTILDSHTAQLEIQEGRYHQVRRMFAALGNHVVSLHRVSIGQVSLCDLKEGEVRMLTTEEKSLF